MGLSSQSGHSVHGRRRRRRGARARSGGFLRSAALAAACLLTLFALPEASARAPRREPPLILGGARVREERPVVVDPRLPTGAAVLGVSRPADPHLAYCSFTRPLCVHAAAGAEADAPRALAALEWAFERLVLAMGLPAPEADAGAGAGDQLDVYLVAPDQSFVVGTELPAPRAFTTAAAFCNVPVADEVLLRRAMTLCVGEAVALGLDASEPPHLRRAMATSLWWQAGAPTALDLEVIDAVQARPERPIATRDLIDSSEGAAIFFEYLENTRSAGGYGELSAALFAAAASRLDRVEPTYVNEPDLFDVLRHSLEGEPARFAELMVDFAVARAFVGDRDDGVHLPSLGWAGWYGRLRFDWTIPFSSLPRQVAIQPPVDSTGSVAIWLSLDEVPIGAALGVRMQWEAPVSFHWQLVRVSAEGQELGRVDVPYQERGREVEARVRNLDDASAVLIVGTNLETIELSHPFDPDVAPFEPHGVTVYLVRL